MTLLAASWTKIVPKTRKTREFWENVPGRLIQSCTIAVAKNSNAITKFLVGSGCWPLKIRNANPAMKAARMKTRDCAAIRCGYDDASSFSKQARAGEVVCVLRNRTWPVFHLRADGAGERCCW